MEVTFNDSKKIDRKTLLDLYNDAGWIAYTNDPDLLLQAVENSLYVLSAWDNEKLVGLVRVVGDGLTIAYIQDILVLKDYKRNKIGSVLMNKVLENFKGVRQKVLLTDDNEETRGFYESLGFESCDKGMLVAYIWREKTNQKT